MADRIYLKVALSIFISFITIGWAGAVGETLYPNNASGPYASNPIPGNGDVIIGMEFVDNIYTTLEFTAGTGAVSHEAFFSDDPARVSARDPNVSLGPPPYFPILRYFVGFPYIEPYTQSLIRGTIYYWCVDETDANGMVWQGPVWNFGILCSDDKAWDPNPPDGQEFVSITPILSWKAGVDAQWHVIYFGTSFDDVNDSVVQPLIPPPLSYRGYQPIGDEDWDPIADGGLTIEFDTTYYWRIDEGREGLPPPVGGGIVIKGDIWSFTTRTSLIFVDMDAAGANDGTSWENAYNYLQDALAEATSGDEIRVAQGVYKPDHGKNQHLEDQYASFQLQNRLTIKGGYAGVGEPDPNVRDIAAYESILSGEISDDEDSCHVVTGSGTDRTAVLDGFIITEGKAYNVSNNNDLGGGMYCYAGSPTVRNCTFTNNWALNYGGGMCNDGNSCPLLINCIFVQNSATDGGGMDNECSNPVLINCVFAGNWVDEYNADSFSGGAIYNYYSSPTLINCTITENVAVKWGVCGGIYNSATSRPTLTNCILWNNINGQIEGSAIVSYSDVQGGWPGLGNFDADPIFGNSSNSDYHLKSQSGRWDANDKIWVIDDLTSPCIDAGNPGCPVGDEPAPNGNRINMGAYGGTAQASKSPENWRSIADLTNDWVVDFNDLKIFVDYWLESGECVPGDLDRSESVDFNDFAIFSQHWSYPSASEPGINYQIKECDPNSFRSLAIEQAIKTRFTVTVEGLYIHFKDMMVANCCTDKLGLEMTVEDNLITIYEIEYIPGVCFCICDYPVTATLGPFEPGTYTLEVYEDYGGYIGGTTVVIEPLE